MRWVAIKSRLCPIQVKVTHFFIVQASGQVGHLSQVVPYAPGWVHSQLPHTHWPRPLHSNPRLDMQVSVRVEQLQFSPDQSGKHWQKPHEHVPCPVKSKSVKHQHSRASQESNHRILNSWDHGYVWSESKKRCSLPEVDSVKLVKISWYPEAQLISRLVTDKKHRFQWKYVMLISV